LSQRNRAKTDASANAEKVPQENQPFTADDLTRAWDAYIETVGGRVNLKHTMINCRPVLKGDDTFEIVVHNPGQREVLLQNNAAILQSLRGQLKNGRVRFTVRIDETNEKRLAYTSKEKYDLLLEVNPALARLKEEFNLTFD